MRENTTHMLQVYLTQITARLEEQWKMGMEEGQKLEVVNDYRKNVL